MSKIFSMKLLVVSLAVTLIGLVTYFAFRPPADLEPMGTQEEKIALFGMIAAICGAITGLLSVIKEILSLVIEAKKGKDPSSEAGA